MPQNSPPRMVRLSTCSERLRRLAARQLWPEPPRAPRQDRHTCSALSANRVTRDLSATPVFKSRSFPSQYFPAQQNVAKVSFQEQTGLACVEKMLILISGDCVPLIRTEKKNLNLLL